jgi:hypothetical protein
LHIPHDDEPIRRAGVDWTTPYGDGRERQLLAHHATRQLPTSLVKESSDRV